MTHSNCAPQPDPRNAVYGHKTVRPCDVVIAVPTLNEEAMIASVLGDLTADGTDWPILVLDGGSTDQTRQIVGNLARANGRICLVDNSERTQSAAINLAARLASAMGARVLIRADAHARYPRSFARGLVQTLDSENCDSVVVPLVASLSTNDQQDWAIAAARLQNSWLGTGGARHRQAARAGFVDHGHHAAFRLRAFLSIGGYDPTFVANEDAEFDLRLSGAGGRIFFQNRWPVDYCPRCGPLALFKQYWRNGRWRMMTAQKHGVGLNLRQMLPLCAVIGVALSLMLSWVTIWWASLAGIYLGTVLTLGIRAGGGQLMPGLRVSILAIAMHFGFGLGLLASAFLQPNRSEAAKARPA